MATPAEGPRERGQQGSIYAYETAAGTRYRFTFRDASGRQTTRRGFLSRRDAQRERERLMGKVHAHQIRVSRESLGGWWARWLEQRRPYLERGSWLDYRSHGERRILPHLGHRRLTSITPPELRDWLTELAADGAFAPKTLNNALKALVVCLNHAVADGLIPMNPAGYVQALPLGHIERDYLRLAEIGAYLDACALDYRPLAETLIGTGMRISEALALTVADLSANSVIVARSFKDDGSVGSTKSDRFRRVEIGPQLAGRLADQVAIRMEQTADAPHQTLLFVCPVRTTKREKGRWSSHPTGELGPIDRNTVSRAWHKEALQDAGLRDMPLHALRHTAAAAWLSTGQPLMYVQRQLGHAQITTTERLYGHLEEAFLRSAAADTEAAIARAAL